VLGQVETPFTWQAEQRYLAGAQTLKKSAQSSASQPVAEDVLYKMQQTLARLYEGLLQTLNGPTSLSREGVQPLPSRR
jgi:hypothetical protein